MRISTVLALSAFALAAFTMPAMSDTPPPAAAGVSPATTTTTTTTTTAIPTPTKMSENDYQNQVICKRVEDTGSRLPAARECHTRAQWAQLTSLGMDTLGVANAAQLQGPTDGGSPTGR
jgi:hypothetical protein